MTQSPATTLTRRERQIMDALYQHGDSSAREIMSALDDPPSYSTVRALLSILRDKGQLTHRQVGARYIYAPVRPVSQARVGALKRLITTFFGGSAVSAVTALMGAHAEELSEQELDELAGLIEQARAKKS